LAVAKSGRDLVLEAKQRIREITPSEVREMVASGEPIAIIDVREPNEWNLGHLPGAVHLPRGTIETKGEALIPRDRAVVLYCGGGSRSALAADTLQQMGYERVSSLAGGFREWVYSGGEVED
jgi:rhodanese-related sulfurtransferase